MNMPIAGRRTISQLHHLIEQVETNPQRRNRLFVRFGSPRAAVIRGLTDNIIRFALSEWESLKGAAVLDYGCGVVPYRKIFELGGAKIIAADIGENPYAQIMIPENGKLPFVDSCFDYVVSFQVLEHVLVPQEYLREAIRLLKPHGRLFLTTHGSWPYHPTPGDYHRWTTTGLSAELEQAGFQVKTVNNILNDYSALIQNFVMTAEYQGIFRRGMGRLLRGIIHLLTHVLILGLEPIGHHSVKIPAVICITGDKL